MHVTAGREVAFRLCGLGVVGFVSFCCCFGLAKGGKIKMGLNSGEVFYHAVPQFRNSSWAWHTWSHSQCHRSSEFSFLWNLCISRFPPASTWATPNLLFLLSATACCWPAATMSLLPLCSPHLETIQCEWSCLKSKGTEQRVSPKEVPNMLTQQVEANCFSVQSEGTMQSKEERKGKGKQEPFNLWDFFLVS